MKFYCSPMFINIPWIGLLLVEDLKKKIICIIKPAIDLCDVVAKVVLLPVGVVGAVGAGDGGRDAHVELQQLPLLNQRQERK